MNDLVTAAIVVIGVPAALVGYILLTERLIQAFPERRQGRIRPWLWVAPAIAFMIVFLIYPTLNTIVLSFQDRLSREFVGFDNYAWFFGDRGTLESLRNSVLWVVFMTLGVVGLGLLVAILVDRVRYEGVAKTVIFLPLAISFVAAAIIWQFMYQYRPPGTIQTGTVNAVLGLIGLGPLDWVRER
jgi:alpha-glucoside transport system permease protein